MILLLELGPPKYRFPWQRWVERAQLHLIVLRKAAFHLGEGSSALVIFWAEKLG